jgi:hypothetical protein
MQALSSCPKLQWRYRPWHIPTAISPRSVSGVAARRATSSSQVVDTAPALSDESKPRLLYDAVGACMKAGRTLMCLKWEDCLLCCAMNSHGCISIETKLMYIVQQLSVSVTVSLRSSYALPYT